MTTEHEAETEGIPSPRGAPDLGSAIAKLMEHPEIIEMAASVLGEPAKEQAEHSPREDAEKDFPTGAPHSEDAPPPDVMRLLGPLLSGKSGGFSREIGRCTALLVALKPYLSKSRCHTVDRIVEIGKLGTLFDRIGGAPKGGDTDVFEKS